MAAKQHTATNPRRAKRRPIHWQPQSLAALPSNEEWQDWALYDLVLLRLARVAMADDPEAALARMTAPSVDVTQARAFLRFLQDLQDRAKIMRARAEILDCVAARMLITLQRVEREHPIPAKIFDEAARVELEAARPVA